MFFLREQLLISPCDEDSALISGESNAGEVRSPGRDSRADLQQRGLSFLPLYIYAVPVTWYELSNFSHGGMSRRQASVRFVNSTNIYFFYAGSPMNLVLLLY